MVEPEHLRMTRVVGKRIRAIRRDRGISQKDLSELSEIDHSNIGKLERGIGNPQLDTLARIALALDTTIADLVADVTHEIMQPRRRRRITARDLIRARLEAEAEAEESAG